MRIYINGRFLTQQITGVQRYAREMVSAIDKIITEATSKDEWYMLVPQNTMQEMPLSAIKVEHCGRLSGHLWEQIELPFYSKDGFLVNLCNCAPLLKRKQMVTIHDAAVAEYPQAYSWAFRTWYRILFRISGRYAEKILTVSNFSKCQINKHFYISLDKIKVTYNGIDHMERIVADESIIGDLKICDEKFVLAVSSQNLTKNFPLIVRTAKLLPNVKFVIVGGNNKTVFKTENNKQLANVIYTGYVSDEKLVSLYRHASVFVYPSLYEGFGIPPLESMYCGCPVIVSTCASLPEVCGDAALYCSPHNSDMLKEMIEKILTDKLLSNTMIQKGLQRAHDFQWENEAMKLFRQIHDINK